MNINLSLKCQCGQVSGVAENVSKKTGYRIVCMCDDCQVYARYLGKGDQVLDSHGGTELMQMTPSQVKITKGQDKIACLRLSPNGLLRFFTSCCHTPIANTLRSHKTPYVGVPHTFINDKKALEENVGPVIAFIQGRFAQGDLPQKASLGVPLWLKFAMGKLLVLTWLKKMYTPTPFFKNDGSPVVRPVLADKEKVSKFKSGLIL